MQEFFIVVETWPMCVVHHSPENWTISILTNPPLSIQESCKSVRKFIPWPGHLSLWELKVSLFRTKWIYFKRRKTSLDSICYSSGKDCCFPLTFSLNTHLVGTSKHPCHVLMFSLSMRSQAKFTNLYSGWWYPTCMLTYYFFCPLLNKWDTRVVWILFGDSGKAFHC